MAEKKKIPVLRFPEFEGEWKKKKIKDLGHVITGNTPKTSRNDFYGGKRLFVSPADLNGVRHISETFTKVTEKGFDTGREIRKGSTMFVCIGSTIGKVAQAAVNCITNQQINSIIPNGQYSDNFIFSLLERNARQIKTLAAIQAVPIINKTT